MEHVTPFQDRAPSFLIAEDDALHKDFLKSVVCSLFPDIEKVVEAESGSDAIESFRSSAASYVIMDLQMPNGSGVEAAKNIWAIEPRTKILFWSNYSDEAYVRAISHIVPNEAVYGYVIKSASEAHLKHAIRGVFIEDLCIVDRGIRRVQNLSSDRHQGLTEVEYEVLIAMSLGLTDKAISAIRRISARSVQSHLNNVYEKLGINDDAISTKPGVSIFNSRTRAIYVAMKRGLINVEILRRRQDELAQWQEDQSKLSVRFGSPP